MKRAIAVGLGLLWTSLAIAAPPALPAPKVLDDFDDIGAWKLVLSDQVSGSLRPVSGAGGGRALCLDYDFHKVSGYVGIRRALGATRTDVMRYFQIENLLIVSIGIAAGALLAYAMNLTLMRFYELPRLPLLYLPVSAVILLLLGQAAVLLPALRAAAIAPVSAIRSL